MPTLNEAFIDPPCLNAEDMVAAIEQADEKRLRQVNIFADATAIIPDLDVGDVVAISGHEEIADGGGGTMVLEATSDEMYPKGGRYRPFEWKDARTWGVVTDGDSGPLDTVTRLKSYTPSGTDNTFDLQKFFNYTLVNGVKAVLPPGPIYVADDLYIGHHTNNPLPRTEANSYSGFILSGNTVAQFSHSQNGIAAPGATSILLAPGKRIIITRAGATNLKCLDIRGSVSDGDLIDAGSAFIQGGGLDRVHITNLNEDATSVGTAALSASGFWYGRENQTAYFGSPNFRDRDEDPTIASPDLYHGVGRRLSPDSAGSLGKVTGSFTGGFRYGYSFGYPFDPDYSGPTAGNIVLIANSAGFCQTGLIYGAGYEDVTLQEWHFEKMRSSGIDMRRGCGDLRINGGSITGARRDENGAGGIIDPTFGYLKDGCIYVRPGAGDLIIDGTKFDFLTQPAILVETSPLFPPSKIRIRSAWAGAQGGPLVGIIDGGGETDIKITDVRGPIQEARMIMSVTRNGDYFQHTFTSARHLARVENARSDFNASLGADIDLSNVLNLPEYLRFSTTGAARTVTLGPNHYGGRSVFQKFTNNATPLSISPKAGLKLIFEGNEITNGGTADLTTIGALTVDFMGNSGGDRIAIVTKG